MKTKMIIAGLALGAASLSLAFARDPRGEEAYYKLDKNSSRTSSMISDGEFNAKVLGKKGSEDSYQVDLDYKFKIEMMGTYKGTKSVDVTADYFTEEFLGTLRDEGTYETADFKMKHMGFEDARNADGTVYKDCDIVLIYDIKTTAFDFIRTMFKDMGAQIRRDQGLPVDPNSDIEDLEILTHVQYGVPVLGAVKLDVKGKYEGMSMKAGADYTP